MPRRFDRELMFSPWRVGVEHTANGGNELRPSVALAYELFLSGGGQPVKLRLLIGVGLPPLRLDPALPLETMQRGIRRAGLDPEGLRRPRADHLCDGVAMLGPHWSVCRTTMTPDPISWRKLR